VTPRRNQATLAVAWATIVQAVVAFIMLIITIRLVILARQQNKNMQLQTQNMEMQIQKMQTQINLSLYKKRFEIYTSLMVLLNTVLDVPLPAQGEDEQRFHNEILSCLQTFWRDSREKEFLLDDELNQYIDSVEKKIKDYLASINREFIPIDTYEYACMAGESFQ